jgi:excisionase family DNA binding protein
MNLLPAYPRNGNAMRSRDRSAKTESASTDGPCVHERGRLSKFFTIAQIAECVGVSKRTVRRWIKEGLLVAHRINGLVRISDADFQGFLATHRNQ